jgi:hypothetical protein
MADSTAMVPHPTITSPKALAMPPSQSLPLIPTPIPARPKTTAVSTRANSMHMTRKMPTTTNGQMTQAKQAAINEVIPYLPGGTPNRFGFQFSFIVAFD